MTDPDPASKLPLRLKFAYGAGELGPAMAGNMVVFYLLFFLTDVAGIPPAMAGTIPMIGKLWDAINDPLIGWLSDRTRSRRWGRRLSWMLACLVPLAIVIVVQWWVPPFESVRAKYWFFVVMVFLYNAVSSAVTVPHTALMPELTSDYEDRTTLVSFRSAFSILGGVAFILLAWIAGQFEMGEQQRYLVIAGACSLVLVSSVLWCVFAIRGQALKRERFLSGRALGDEAPSAREQLKIVLTNRPFLIVCAVFTFSWLAVQVTATVLVYYAVYWTGLGKGQVPLLMLTVMGVAVLTLPFWVAVCHRIGKRAVYSIGMGTWILAQVGLVFLARGEVGAAFALAAVAGVGVSTAYLIPWSLIPEVIEYDELRSGRRREGIYYGFMVLIQKIGLGLAIFLVGQALDAAGFIEKVPGEAPPVQPESALAAIRMVIGPLPGIALIIGLAACWFYPITKKRYRIILRKLEMRTGMILHVVHVSGRRTIV